MHQMSTCDMVSFMDADLITAREAARLAHKSRSKIHRDALAGVLPVAQQFPGYNGPRLFRREDVLSTYRRAS